METEGLFAPETAAEARERYDSVEPTAETTVKQVATATELGTEEYDERVTEAVVETAQEVLFAALLAVRVGGREAFERWRAEHEGWTVVVTGFHEQRQAAVETLRRQAFDCVYSEGVRCAG